jgi:transcriptional regulator with XRE-family HTH domain
MSKERAPDEEDRARGARLRKLREERGLTQTDVAKRAGFENPEGAGRQQVSRLESGHLKFTSVEQQSGYARAYETTVGAIVEYARGERPVSELPAATSGRSDATRVFVPDPGHARPSDDGRWRDYADGQPAFLRLATKMRTRSKTNAVELALVEGALDIASDALRHHGGGELDDAAVLVAYREAWAYVNDEEAPVPRVPAREVSQDRPAPTKGTIKERAAAAKARRSGA